MILYCQISKIKNKIWLKFKMINIKRIKKKMQIVKIRIKKKLIHR